MNIERWMNRETDKKADLYDPYHIKSDSIAMIIICRDSDRYGNNDFNGSM